MIEVKRMRHIWHYARSGRKAGKVVCIRRGCRAVKTSHGTRASRKGLPYAKGCRIKKRRVEEGDQS